MNIESLLASVFDLVKADIAAYHGMLDAHFEVPGCVFDLATHIGAKATSKQFKNGVVAFVTIDFGRFTLEGLDVKYSMQIEFSKAAPCYWYYFRVEIEDPDPRSMSKGSIVGDAYAPYTVTQQIYLDQLTAALQAAGYLGLSRDTLDAVLCDTPFIHESMRFYGDQTTVGMILFNGFFDTRDET